MGKTIDIEGCLVPASLSCIKSRDLDNFMTLKYSEYRKIFAKKKRKNRIFRKSPRSIRSICSLFTWRKIEVSDLRCSNAWKSSSYDIQPRLLMYATVFSFFFKLRTRGTIYFEVLDLGTYAYRLPYVKSSHRNRCSRFTRLASVRTLET